MSFLLHGSVLNDRGPCTDINIHVGLIEGYVYGAN